ncbi:MAG: primosomal protein N' [Victivallales bacterium]|nr:primosomal protein N' [Victivallales bacterium]MCF7889248.1 primosomal protein N' [Victivallales bacterium]
MENRIKIARILVDLSLNKHFDYSVPAHLVEKIKIGTYVNVPFGKGKDRQIRGCVIGFPTHSPSKKLKEIRSLSENNLTLPEPLIKLGEWIAEYYCSSREQALRTLLPGAVRSGKISKKSTTYIFLPDPKKATDYLFKNCGNFPSRRRVIQKLIQKPDLPQALLLKQADSSPAVINTLVKHGILKKEKRHIERSPFNFETAVSSQVIAMTDEQESAVNKITDMLLKRTRKFTALLHGVTGSGKTEVYLRAIEKCLKMGKEAVVLVPEISLTPQTTERFRSRFGNLVSVLHSGLSDGERFDEWMKIYESRVKIVVGARSALFAPFRNLGLIVVDEEHENSYKQDEAPGYHARDVAVMRAFRENAVAVLGSATPSIESFYNAENEKYELLTLTKRVEDLVMPKVNIVDMATEAIEQGGGLFSRKLTDAVYKRLNNAEQSILFLNRRGFSTYLSCPVCNEYVATCSNCSISYTYHKSKGCLSCHICGSIVPAPTVCPNCNSPEIRYGGTGTEKIEDVAARLFPHAKIVRMDSDTMVNRKSYETVLSSFRKGEIDILIGTQMIAKGLDFPNVTLVGVINADTALNLPDFRAAEKTFQLLTQVAGRAGRGIVPGEVFIQTRFPYNSAIQFAVNHDYISFYNEEISIRRQLKYPPAGHLAMLKFSGENQDLVSEIAEKIYEKIINIAAEEKTMISPVCPAPISKINNKYRYSIMLRGIIPKVLKKYLKTLVFNKYRTKGLRVQIDIDALSMM